ncbi:protein of unknown function (plasmid) [Caballeronia sp. S22]
MYDEAFDAVGIERIAVQNDGVPPTLQNLATTLVIKISAVTHALRPLVRDGLVALRPDEQDGRAKCAALRREFEWRYCTGPKSTSASKVCSGGNRPRPCGRWPIMPRRMTSSRLTKAPARMKSHSPARMKSHLQNKDRWRQWPETLRM